MPTLATAMFDLARLLTHVHTGSATSAGTTTTLVDTGLNEPDDHFLNGLILFKSGTLAGKLFRVTDYVKSTGTITFTPAATAAPGTGAAYDVVGVEYPEAQLINAINQALAEFPVLPAENTTLVGVVDQLDYTLPAGVSNVLQVEVAKNTVAPFGYAVNYHWDELATGVLRFGYGFAPEADVPIRITYRAPYVFLDTPETDTISFYINAIWLSWAAAVYALRDRMREEGRDNSMLIERLNEAKMEERRLRSSVFLIPMKRTPRWGDLR